MCLFPVSLSSVQGGYQCYGDGRWQERPDIQRDQQIPGHTQGNVSNCLSISRNSSTSKGASIYITHEGYFSLLSTFQWKFVNRKISYSHSNIKEMKSSWCWFQIFHIFYLRLIVFKYYLNHSYGFYYLSLFAIFTGVVSFIFIFNLDLRLKSFSSAQAKFITQSAWTQCEIPSKANLLIKPHQYGRVHLVTRARWISESQLWKKLRG